MKPPSLKGGVVRLRPLMVQDFESLSNATSDPAIWALHSDRNRRDVRAFVAYFDSLLHSGIALIAEDIKEGITIGASRYADVRKSSLLVKIGWSFLTRTYWGGEYDYRIKRLMINHALQYYQGVLF